MPSPLELLRDGPDTHTPTGPPSEDLLGSVKAEGVRRRSSRHRRALAGAVLALGLVAAPAVAFRSGDDGAGRTVSVASGGEGVDDGSTPVPADDVVAPTDLAEPVATVPDVPTTLPTPSPEATTAVPPSVSPTTGVAPPPPTVPRTLPSTTTTMKPAPACRNSSDPACGTFRWDPAPSANQPLEARFTKEPAGPIAAGSEFVFEVEWSDGDAELTYDQLSTGGGLLGAPCSMEARYGPSTPPPVAPGRGVLRYPTTFPAAGEYEVAVALGTADCASPYGNDLTVAATKKVTVT